jgi:ankyrin repeat protein
MLLIQEKLRKCISDHCFIYYVARMREKWWPDICFVETEEEEAIDALLSVAKDYGVTVTVISDNDKAPPDFGMDGPRKSQMGFLRAQFAKGQLLCMSKEVGSPLHTATAEAKPATIYALIQAGADVNARNEEGETPLYIAAEEGNSEIIAALMEAGADVNAPDDGGWTPLHVAAREGPPASVSALIQAGADVNARTRDRAAGATPLHFAANPEIIAALIKAGADINARIIGEVFAGATPLHIAAQSGSPADVEALLDAGADGSLANDEGKTPFDLIKENQYYSFDGTAAYTRLEKARHN